MTVIGCIFIIRNGLQGQTGDYLITTGVLPINEKHRQHTAV
jgi:hypothetical protein